MEASSLLSSNINQELINTVLHKMLFTAYATVTGISETDPLAVLVQGCVCNGGMPFTTKARLVYPTTKFVQMAFKPEVGDKVLVIGLQAYSDKMFESTETLTENDENNVQHYTILGCVAIPLNIESDKAALRISNTNESITINEGDDPVVRWSELNKVLESLWKAYNCHYHGSEGANPPSNLWETNVTPTPGTPQPVPPGLFSDLASEVLAVPKASTGGA